MSFEAPALLVALLVVPLAVGAYVVLERRTSRYGVSFSNLDVLAAVVQERRPWGRHLPAALLLAAVAALCIALARPTVTVAAPQERATVVLLVDVSGSMRAEDVAPSRLEAARAAMHSFLDRVPKQIRVVGRRVLGRARGRRPADGRPGADPRRNRPAHPGVRHGDRRRPRARG